MSIFVKLTFVRGRDVLNFCVEVTAAVVVSTSVVVVSPTGVLLPSTDSGRSVAPRERLAAKRMICEQ